MADDYEDFYDGDWDDEANDRDESGADGPDTSVAANYPWTGCKHDGTEETSLALGLKTLGQDVRVGRPNSDRVRQRPHQRQFNSSTNSEHTARCTGSRSSSRLAPPVTAPAPPPG